MSGNLAGLLLRTATDHGGRPAIAHRESTLSYAELDDASARMAGLLRERGLRAGERVAVHLPNGVAFPVCALGVLRAGGVVVPLGVLLAPRELRACLADCDPLLTISADAGEHPASGVVRAGGSAGAPRVDPARVPDVLEGRRPDPDVAPVAAPDPAAIFYTSGTTGAAKGVEHSHGSLSRHADLVVEALEGELGPGDVVLAAPPFFHNFGCTCGLHAALRAGALVVTLPRFEAGAALAAMGERRVTVLVAVPTMLAALLAEVEARPGGAPPVRSLRLCLSGGAPLPAALRERFEAAFRCRVLGGWGMTETQRAALERPSRAHRPGASGPPLPGVEIAALDGAGRPLPAGRLGELGVRGPTVMTGYWRRPDASAAARAGGWVRTGDVGRVEAGEVHVVGRARDLILRGGYTVDPREVEEVLAEHPAVAEAAVVGMPDDRLGEEVGAAVVLAPGARAEPDDLRDFCRRHVAAYKYPRRVWLVDELPKGPTGKVVKREVALPA